MRRWSTLALGLLVTAGVLRLWLGGAADSARSDRTRTPIPTTLPTTASAGIHATPPEPTVTPRQITVRARWRAPEGRDAEEYSEGSFERVELRYGEKLYIKRVCVSDARKLTMISYTAVSGSTGVTLLLGERRSGHRDPTDRNCTLFDGVEVAKVEKCKCWFQCAGEEHVCEVSAVARRP